MTLSDLTAAMSKFPPDSDAWRDFTANCRERLNVTSLTSTAGVDAPTRQALQRFIQDLAARGTAIVMATHHRAEWPAGATHELELAKGRMRYGGRLRLG